MNGEDDSDRHATDNKSEYPHTSVCKDSDVDIKCSQYEEDAHDQLNGSSGSEHTEISNCEDHLTSKASIGEDVHELPLVHKEASVHSKTFKFLIIIQLVLILFFILPWGRSHV
ncbi:hypothetical protein B0H12DRAFT_234357 [Mycena haematopus]|nr:hypothetical protein B0H12DRAFT_234357 [Mycena haematopus]